MTKYCASMLMALLVVFVVGVTFATELPQSALSKIVDKDFDGDGSYRVGKVIFTDNRQSVIGDCDCSTPRELFYALYDPIVIVTDWKILEVENATPENATISVRYHVLAATKGQGDYTNNDRQREIEPLTLPRDEIVTYHMHLKDDEWLVVDPPLPRVGVDNLVLRARKALSKIERAIKRHPAADPHSKGHRAAYEWLKKQLATLEVLRKTTDAGADRPK